MVRRDEAVRGLLHALACALSAIVIVIAGGACADAASDPTRIGAHLSDMRAGRLEHARSFLEQAEPANEEERIERLFRLGRIDMRLGVPSRAAERFEALLAMRTGLTRVRLELARAY